MHMSDSSSGRLGRMLRILLGGIGVLVVALWATHYFACPCGYVFGGPLSGNVATAAVDDWSFANDVPLCQVEVHGWYTYSINVNCMSYDQDLYVSCSACEGKTWSGIALAAPNGRIRLDKTVYPVTMTRIDDPALKDAVWEMRLAKIGAAKKPRPDGWWTFKMEPR